LQKGLDRILLICPSGNQIDPLQETITALLEAPALQAGSAGQILCNKQEAQQLALKI
jgi:hypothetical protein